MKTRLVETWNKSHAKIPSDKDESRYAIEKEFLLPRNSLICDFGGGTGADSLYFLKKGHSVVFLDISSTAIDAANKKVKENGLSDKFMSKQTDFSEDSVPLEDNYVDIVYSRLAIHYFTKERTIEILKEIKRILKPGGKAYITVKSPDDKNEMNFLKETATEIEKNVFDDNGQIKSRYEIKEWEKMLHSIEVDNYSVQLYEEDLGGRKDIVKSGLDKFMLTEIIFTK